MLIYHTTIAPPSRPPSRAGGRSGAPRSSVASLRLDRELGELDRPPRSVRRSLGARVGRRRAVQVLSVRFDVRVEVGVRGHGSGLVLRRRRKLRRSLAVGGRHLRIRASGALQRVLRHELGRVGLLDVPGHVLELAVFHEDPLEEADVVAHLDQQNHLRERQHEPADRQDLGMEGLPVVAELDHVHLQAGLAADGGQAKARQVDAHALGALVEDAAPVIEQRLDKPDDGARGHVQRAQERRHHDQKGEDEEHRPAVPLHPGLAPREPVYAPDRPVLVGGEEGEQENDDVEGHDERQEDVQDDLEARPRVAGRKVPVHEIDALREAHDGHDEADDRQDEGREHPSGEEPVGPPQAARAPPGALVGALGREDGQRDQQRHQHADARDDCEHGAEETVGVTVEPRELLLVGAGRAVVRAKRLGGEVRGVGSHGGLARVRLGHLRRRPVDLGRRAGGAVGREGGGLLRRADDDGAAE
mmetsp:Transcript_2652/g.10604  ORF Transcript_2652/g.10604 Transcript_2652/m.10604 type:complete len:473 (-) Transcript_2652:1649-3067(-)